MERCNVTDRTITNLKQLKNIQEAIAIKISKSIGVKPEVLFDISVKPGGLSERTIQAVINIDKALQHTKSKGTFIKSTKTENTRLISIDEEVMDLLKKYRKWQNEERLKLSDLWKRSNYLFTAIDGGSYLLVLYLNGS